VGKIGPKQKRLFRAGPQTTGKSLRLFLETIPTGSPFLKVSFLITIPTGSPGLALCCKMRVLFFGFVFFSSCSAVSSRPLFSFFVAESVVAMEE
jgi:hypothetical protein